MFKEREVLNRMENNNQSGLEEKLSIAKKTLENKDFQNILGSNQVKSNPFMYGQLGVQGADSTYSEIMKGDLINKTRNNLINQKKNSGDSLGVYGQPSVSDYDVSIEIIQQIEENKKLLPLGELENITKEVAGGIEFEIPEELKNYNIKEIETKIQRAEIEEIRKGGKISPEKIQGSLTEEEIDAFDVYQALSQAYNRGAALNSVEENYFSDINESLRQISGKYNAEEN